MAAVQNPQQAFIASRIVAGKMGRTQYGREFPAGSVAILHILYQHIAIGMAGCIRTAQLTELLLPWIMLMLSCSLPKVPK